MNDAPRAAAFFDLDRTIIGGSSVFMLGWAAYRAGMVPTRRILTDAIAKLAAQQGYDLALSYSYTDSAGDLSMLEVVGHPVAVNPDRALEAIAEVRGWPIVELSRARKRVVKRTTAALGAATLAATMYGLGRRHGRAAA